MMARKALVVRAAAGIVAALALAAPASAATLDAGSLLMLTGQPSLLAPFPEPVGGVLATTRTAASQDGRFVAFSASSDGLSAADDDTIANVYVKDRQTGAVTFASRRDGVAGEPSHSSCFDASISDDGNRVAFTCYEPLDPADTNTSSDVYKLTLRFERPGPGRRATIKGRRVCKPAKRRPKLGACPAYRHEGTLTRNIRDGAGAVALSGRINRRSLPRGVHRLTLVATDAAGNSSRPVRISFRIVA